MSYTSFKKIIWNHYRKNGRHELPWRKTRDPYKILVSEIMLQQTQVERVIPFYLNFLKKFPNAKSLARAPLSQVLAAWQGLGYNRRAKMLHNAAKEIAKNGIPKDAEALDELPGVGPYTARAVAAFAYNHDGVFVETNVRTVVMHHFFSKKKRVTDAEIAHIVSKTLPKGRAREWYAALMDYGSFLKRSGLRLNEKSAYYAKQQAFTGSLREARGAIIRALLGGSTGKQKLTGVHGPSRRAQMTRALTALVAEGLVKKTGDRYTLVD